MRILFLRLICLLVICTATNTGKAQSGETDYEKGYTAQFNRDFKKAIELYNKSIKEQKDVYQSLVSRARCYYELGEYKKATEDWDSAIKLEPNNAYVYSSRAFTVMNHDNEQALRDFSTAIKMEPLNKYNYWTRAICYRLRREYTKALADINRTLQLDSNQVNVYGTRAMVNTDLGRYERAVEDIKTIQRKDKSQGFGYYLVNVFEPLARMHRFTDAVSYYNIIGNTELGRLDTDSYSYYVIDLKSVLKYFEEKDYLMAAEMLTEMQKNYSSDTSHSMIFQRRSYSFLLSLKGYALENMGKLQEATEAYRQALLFNDDQPEVKDGLARLKEKANELVKNDTQGPQIEILEPSKSRSISIEDDNPASSKQRIRGQVKDAGGVKSVKVNNVAVNVEENGYFETVVALMPGKNIFSVVAIDNAANVTSANVEVEAAKSGGTKATQTQNIEPTLDNTPVYHAILIAASKYTDMNIDSLPGPVADMEKIYSLLVNQYSFSPTRVIKLVNPSKTNILETIAKVSNLMTANDNLFIFYAGHGQMVKRPDGKEDGYLVPSDAIKGALSTYIYGDDIFRTFQFSKAKHILVVADACFAGSLFRSMKTEAEVSVQEAYKDQSRKVLASGNRTVVPDESKFIAYLQTTLLNNRRKYVTADQIIYEFKRRYDNETGLNLQYYPIAGVDFGGQFVFMRK